MMHQNRIARLFIFAALFISINVNNKATAQQNNQIVRLAKIQVDPARLTAYNEALKLQIKTAVQLEPGVLTYTV